MFEVLHKSLCLSAPQLRALQPNSVFDCRACIRYLGLFFKSPSEVLSSVFLLNLDGVLGLYFLLIWFPGPLKNVSMFGIDVFQTYAPSKSCLTKAIGSSGSFEPICCTPGLKLVMGRTTTSPIFFGVSIPVNAFHVTFLPSLL